MALDPIFNLCLLLVKTEVGWIYCSFTIKSETLNEQHVC